MFQEIKKNLHCIVSFFSEDAVAYGIDGLMFPLCNNTALRLVLLESINNLQLAGLCSHPSSDIKPPISLQ